MAERVRKRPAPTDEFDSPPSMHRRVRFPKGKKVKRSDDGSTLDGTDEGDNWMNPQLAAKERAKLRNKMRENEVLGDQVEGFSGEVQYEDNANFEDDGIQIEPFNLRQEREEGYFDANGNFVEYAKQNEIKDAWLDNVEVDTKFAKKIQRKVSAEVYEDLSSDDLGRMKRRIANALQPGETIIQALKRLKGSSTDKKAKMLDTTKQIFDQLTEDAMKLMENGEYNVYYEDQETFIREAEGYERLARAKADKNSSTKGSELIHREDIFSVSVQHGGQETTIWDTLPEPSAVNDTIQQVSPGDTGDKIDMFGDDDDNADDNPLIQQATRPTSGTLDSSQDLDSGDVGHGGVENDYVYDQSSGYYYSSSLGYYYDPASGMYCSATTGTWYTFDEQSGTYNEVQSSTSGS